MGCDHKLYGANSAPFKFQRLRENVQQVREYMRLTVYSGSWKITSLSVISIRILCVRKPFFSVEFAAISVTSQMPGFFDSLQSFPP